MGATPSKKDKKSEKKGKHNRREEEEENTEVPASEPKSKGSTFGHVDESTEKYYTVGSSIGKGSYSKVYRGININTGEEVAIKRIDKTHVSINKKANIDREIEIMKSLDHPNIIKLYDVFDRANELDLIFEYASGGELLDKIVDAGNFSEANTINVIKQVLSALAEMHAKSIAHRDLKPENLLCAGSDDNLTVKISDFGLSKSFSPTDELKTVVGVPDYAAPEVISMDGTAYTTAVDMWSLGVITYVLLTGFHPFSGDNDVETLKRVTSADYYYPDDLFEGISPEAKEFIDRCLELDPEKRITAADALKHPWIVGGGNQAERSTTSLGTYMVKRREGNN